MAIKRLFIVDNEDKAVEFRSNAVYFKKDYPDAFYMYVEYNYSAKDIVIRTCFIGDDEFKKNDEEKPVNKTSLTKLFSYLDEEILNEYNLLLYNSNSLVKDNEYDEEYSINKINAKLENYLFVKNENECEKYRRLYNEMKAKYKASISKFKMYDNTKNLDSINSQLQYVDSVNTEKYFYRIFNVGQANCTALYNKDLISPEVIFDLGCQRGINNNPQIYMLKNLGNNFTKIIISHFDLDHFNMYNQINYSKFNGIFITPEFPSGMQGVNLTKFANELANNNITVIQIKNDSLIKPIKLPNIKLYQGMKSKRCQGSLKNTRCIVSVIKVNSSSVIIPGDALEEEFDIEEKILDYGLISHHCCSYRGKMNYFVKLAFMPVERNKKKSYGHPALNHANLYNKIFRFVSKKPKIFDGLIELDDDVTLKSSNELEDIKLY